MATPVPVWMTPRTTPAAGTTPPITALASLDMMRTPSMPSPQTERAKFKFSMTRSTGSAIPSSNPNNLSSSGSALTASTASITSPPAAAAAAAAAPSPSSDSKKKEEKKPKNDKNEDGDDDGDEDEDDQMDEISCLDDVDEDDDDDDDDSAFVNSGDSVDAPVPRVKSTHFSDRRERERWKKLNQDDDNAVLEYSLSNSYVPSKNEDDDDEDDEEEEEEEEDDDDDDDDDGEEEADDAVVPKKKKKKENKSPVVSLEEAPPVGDDDPMDVDERPAAAVVVEEQAPRRFTALQVLEHLITTLAPNHQTPEARKILYNSIEGELPEQEILNHQHRLVRLHYENGDTREEDEKLNQIYSCKLLYDILHDTYVAASPSD